MREQSGPIPAVVREPFKRRLRQEQARRILAKRRAYLQEQLAVALPKSPLGAAISYALRNWVALTRYAVDGRLKIDNNGAEQALPTAVAGVPWLP